MGAALKTQRSPRTKPPEIVFGPEHNGIEMTPAEFDRAEFDEFYNFELIRGLLIVTPIPLEEEADPNEELGFLLRLYAESHPQGHHLDVTLAERYVRPGRNRRKPDRIIWAGLGRMPERKEKPTIIVEFASKRKRDRTRDYVEKRKEYFRLGVKEYWIVDRFQRTMTVHIRGKASFQSRVIQESETYETNLLPGFILPLARLFERSDRWATGKE